MSNRVLYHLRSWRFLAILSLVLGSMLSISIASAGLPVSQHAESGGVRSPLNAPSAPSVPGVPNAPGDLDPTFDGDGKVTTDIPGPTSGDAYASVLQPDGKIVLAGFANAIDGMAFGLMRLNGDGSLDTSFGREGKITTNFVSGEDRANAVALQADGKIVAAGHVNTGTGNSFDFALARYNPDGSLDTSFDGDGKLNTNLQGYDKANAVAVQADGKIVVAGRADTGNQDFGLARYNTDGTLDASFDGDGKVFAGFDFGSMDEANGLAIQPDGKIVAVGRAGNSFGLMRFYSDGTLDAGFDGDGKAMTQFPSDSRAYAVALGSDGKLTVAGSFSPGSYDDFALARYNPNGSLDTSFDGEGMVTTSFGTSFDIAYAVKIQADGKIVAAGRADRADDGTQTVTADFGVARYNPDGSLDTSIDGDGMVSTYYTPSYLEIARSVLFQPGDKILAVGFINNHPDTQALLIRYNSDGSLDTSFDGDGKLVLSADISGDNRVYGVKIQADGKTVTAGSLELGGIGRFFSLARYNSDGSADTTFGNNGKVKDSFGAIFIAAQALAIQPDGKIVAAGYFYVGSGNENFILARYNSNGTLDPDFGTGGRIITDFDGGVDRAKAIVLQSDGKIVAAGSTLSRFALARYNSDGTLDTGFGTGGQVTTNFGSGDDIANAVAIQADGKIVAAGVADQSGNPDFALARYETNGNLDTTFDGDGKVMTDFPGQDQAKGVQVQSDGLIVAAGISNGNYALARYLTNGAGDPNFGTGGLVTTDFGGFDDGATALNIQSDGKLLAGGYSNAGSTYDFALARYETNGTLDGTFGTLGKVTTDFAAGNDRANAMDIQSGTKAVLGGFANNGSDVDFALARYMLTNAPLQTNTPTIVPTATRTSTSTAVAPSATGTRTGTATGTGTSTTVPPSATQTGTSTVAATSTRTNTPLPTQTSGGPSATTVPSNTPTTVPPSATRTSISTSTGTSTSISTSTNTATVAAPSPTRTGTGTGTATTQVVSPTATSQATATSVVTATPCTISFVDVLPDNTFYEFIRCLACRGIISGYSDGTFRPNSNISRGQIAKMVSNSASFGEDPGAQIYEDVPLESPFYAWINRLSLRGHMGGYNCGIVPEEPCGLENRPYFRPSASATRGQLAKIVSNAAGLAGTPTSIFYTDVQADNPFYVWVMRLTTLGAMSGYNCDGPNEPCDELNRPYFRPYNTVTRGQASKIVANTFFPGCQTPARRETR